MKRFTATEKWGKEWFQALKPKMKCMWLFICDNADHCGVWEPNFGLASYQIGERITEADMAQFGNRVHRLPTGKFLIVTFIEFQFGKLSDSCPAHKPVFRAMEKNRVSNTLLDTLCGRLLHSLQEEEEEEEEEEVRVGEKVQKEGAEQVYAEYPKKTGKQEALKHIRAAMKSVPVERLIERTRAYAAAVSTWPASDHQFVPDPERWFRKGRWDDDPETWTRKTPAPAGAREQAIHDEKIW